MFLMISHFLALSTIGSLISLPVTAQDDVLKPSDQVEYRVQPFLESFDDAFEVVLRLNDEKEAENDDKKSADKAEKDQPSKTEYWLGIQVATVPEVAKRQLAIDHGLAVEDVAPDSPAAKAEIKKYDILLEAGDTPLKSVGDLIKSVEAAKGKQITIVLKRDGQSRKVEAVAEQRPRVEATAEMIRKKIEMQRPQLAGEIKQLEEAIEKLKEKAGKEGFGMWFAKPAIVSPRVDVRLKEEARSLKADLPNDLSVQINKRGSEPTKIHVKRGDQEWDVTEDKLGDLPEDVRIHVQKLLGQLKGPAGSVGHAIRVTPQGKVEGEFRIPPMPPKPPMPPGVPANPRAPATPATAARAITARVERHEDHTDEKLDIIMKKLDKLEKEIDHLRDKK